MISILLTSKNSDSKYYKKNRKYEPKDFCQANTINLGLQLDAKLGDEQALMLNEIEIQERIGSQNYQKN